MTRTREQQQQVERLKDEILAIVQHPITPTSKVLAILALPGIGIVDSHAPVCYWAFGIKVEGSEGGIPWPGGEYVKLIPKE